MNHPLTRRFWDKVDKSCLEGCWVWTGARTHNGYGVFHLPGTRSNGLAHRLVLQATAGDAPEGKPLALHTCDNPPCVNPAHLWWGSAKENTEDMCSKGRARGGSPAGQGHHSCRVSAEDRLNAKYLYRLGLRQWQIGRILSVSQAHVSKILREGS